MMRSGFRSNGSTIPCHHPRGDGNPLSLIAAALVYVIVGFWLFQLTRSTSLIKTTKRRNILKSAVIGLFCAPSLWVLSPEGGSYLVPASVAAIGGLVGLFQGGPYELMALEVEIFVALGILPMLITGIISYFIIRRIPDSTQNPVGDN